MLGRRLLSLGNRDGIASVLQGQMLSSKEITRWSPSSWSILLLGGDAKHLSIVSPSHTQSSLIEIPGAALSSRDVAGIYGGQSCQHREVCAVFCPP